MYKNFIFDLYGTLIDIRTNEEKASLWRKMSYICTSYGIKKKPAELKAAFEEIVRGEMERLKERTPYPEIRIEDVFLKLAGTGALAVDADEMPAGVNADEGSGLPACRAFAPEALSRAFRAESIERLRLFPGVLRMLSEIKKSGGKIYLLSNAQRIFAETEMEICGIAGCFDGTVISSDEGISKPSPDFFEIPFERFALKKEESVMIGNDLFTDINGAAGAGIDAVLVNTLPGENDIAAILNIMLAKRK